MFRKLMLFSLLGTLMVGAAGLTSQADAADRRWRSPRQAFRQLNQFSRQYDRFQNRAFRNNGFRGYNYNYRGPAFRPNRGRFNQPGLYLNGPRAGFYLRF